jgi:cytochrome c-type biogenesis protein CcmH
LQIRLAEALIFAANGEGSPEAMELLHTVAAENPDNALARLYIASDLMRQGQYGDAATAWQEAIALAQGDEPWLPAAQQGLAAAENNGDAPQNQQDAEMIGQMVSGLAARLAEQGGSIEEWTQLVRAYLVLGDTASAQQALDQAVAAYPQTFDRGELDILALGAGLTIKGATP